jgi:peptide/nickel transport system substrate-binding protein
MLAEAWEPNEDVTEYVLNLRPGVKFSHGKEVQAEDVVFTFERLTDPDVGSPARSSLASIEGVEEIDPYTVRLRLNSPNAFLPVTLSLYQGRIIPSDIDPARLANETFGTGAYRLKEHLPGERTSFERNPEYWDDGKPYVDELTFVYMPDPIGRLEALRAGSVDVVFPLEPAQLRAVDGMQGAVVSETPSAGYLNLAMHVDTPPFDDVRVRRAVQLVLDRDFVNEAVLFGRGVAGNDHPIPPFDPHWWEGQEIPAQDIDQARSLLEQAGHGRGLNLTLHTSTVSPGMVEFAVAFRELAAPAGLNVEIQRQPEDSYWSEVWLKEPFTTVGWNGRNPDEALSVVYLSDADWNESRYQNPEFDDLVVRARGLADLEERKEAYGRVQQILIEDAPRPIPVFKPIFGAHRDRVGGFQAHPNNWLLLHDAWLADA